MDVKSLICKAEKCSAEIAHKLSKAKTFGNSSDLLFNNLLVVNAYIRTLKRNIPETIKKKVKLPIDGQVVDFSSLKRKNNVLILETTDKYQCIEVEVEKCISCSDLQKIFEEIEMLCPDCDNCN